MRLKRVILLVKLSFFVPSREQSKTWYQPVELGVVLRFHDLACLITMVEYK